MSPRSVWALMPSYGAPPKRALLEETLRHVAGLLVVDDGSPDADAVARVAAEVGAHSIRLPENQGKGNALVAGLEWLAALPVPPEAVLVLDADGQHPPASIPDFIAAADDADLVIGDRFGDRAQMPPHRRAMNLAAAGLLSLAVGRRVRDTQSGMRLLRARALHEVRFPGGRYESETRHLKQALRAGLAVVWVPIPAIYDDERSSFRAGRDTFKVLAALLERDERAPRRRDRRPRRASLPRARRASSALPGTRGRARRAPRERAAAA